MQMSCIVRRAHLPVGRRAQDCSARISNSQVFRLQRLCPARRRLPAVKAQETETKAADAGAVSEDDCDYNVTGEYCSIDSQGRRIKKRSLGEMEQEYLQALSAYYFDGKTMMTDDEFDLLKEELIWNGSKVPLLDSVEQQFLEATISYNQGKPILSDEEYDAIKQELKAKNSVVAAEGPRCSIRSKKMYSDATPDYLKLTLLNIPATLLVLGVVFSIDDLTGFEITQLIELPPPYGILALWGLLLPVVFVLATSITSIVLKDGVILKGACPNCGTETFTYFGDIFTVPGNKGQNLVECTSCKSSLVFDSNKKIVVVAATGEEKAAAAAAAAAKKKAAAAAK